MRSMGFLFAMKQPAQLCLQAGKLLKIKVASECCGSVGC